MNERNVTQFGFLAILSDFFLPLKWVLIAAGVIILVDLKFGISAAKQRGETVRTSRAIRRTLNKVVDYSCWIVLSGVIGKAFGDPFDIPLLPMIMLVVIFGCEINSCFSNYFESKGKKIKVNIFRLFGNKVSDIVNIDCAEKKKQTKKQKHEKD